MNFDFNVLHLHKRQLTIYIPWNFVRYSSESADAQQGERFSVIFFVVLLT